MRHSHRHQPQKAGKEGCQADGLLLQVFRAADQDDYTQQQTDGLASIPVKPFHLAFDAAWHFLLDQRRHKEPNLPDR